MARLQAMVEVSATTEVELRPALKRKLLMELGVYASIKAQQAELAEALAEVAGNIEAMREEADAKSIRLEGAGLITRVDGGTSKKLNKKKLCAKGITPAMLEDCYDTSPKRAYTLITLPGEDTKGDSE